MPDYKKIKLVILDVDGTLTDGGIYYDSLGNEMKRFDVKDGLAIKVGLAAGIQFAVLTGRESPMVERRVKELGIQYLRSGVQVKYPAMMELLGELNLSLDEVCYIGDDWNDMQCMQATGLSMCPEDAADEIIDICDYKAERSGGHGAVRCCIKQLLNERGEWEKECVGLYVG